ncbi:MAG: SIMPL domain-containing protein [Gammaproteobacteria bacterium]|nr:SIMPL domain-containing protein [Gammaproteobacteria bacterium]MDH5592473.1 SIMPL domain-containing protein [Gammaproteobacteria bacterium]
MFILFRLIAALFILLAAVSVSADTIAQYERISLQAIAVNNVANDVLVATLVVQENGKNPAKLAQRVNQKMTQVLDKVAQIRGIVSHTTNYNSHPIYKNGQINSWEVSQQLRLTSQNYDQLGKVIADLNELTTVQSMVFSVSDEVIDSIKEELTKQAITKFRAKATLIAKQFGKTNYRLVHVSVDGNQPIPRPMMEKALMSDSHSATSPALSAGINKVSVTVSGTIELLSAEQ